MPGSDIITPSGCFLGIENNFSFCSIWGLTKVFTYQKHTLISGYLNGITAKDYETIAFTLTCSEETLKRRHDRRGDKGETNYFWLHLPPCPGDIVIDTDNKGIREVVKEMKKEIDHR